MCTCHLRYGIPYDDGLQGGVGTFNTANMAQSVMSNNVNYQPVLYNQSMMPNQTTHAYQQPPSYNNIGTPYENFADLNNPTYETSQLCYTQENIISHQYPTQPANLHYDQMLEVIFLFLSY